MTASSRRCVRARYLAWAGALALALWGTGCADPRWAGGVGSELGRYETQVREWRDLATRGFPDARFELDRGIARGELKGDRDAARAGLERAYAAGDTRAALELGRLFGDPTFEQASEREAVRWLERAREADRPGAARELALRQIDGRGVRRDVPAALDTLARLANEGDAQAAYALGRAAARGAGGGQPAPEIAAGWYLAAARGGHEDARVALAALQLVGHGMRQDAFSALRVLERAAGEGNPQAARILAEVTADPAFEVHDPRKAKRWSEALAYFEASPRGLSPRFGSAEVEDRGRREQRLRLWERYARLGNRDAARALGDWYTNPIDGSAPDTERALRAYRVAAAGGDAAAIVALVRSLNAARASAAQRKEARAWLRQGAALGDPALQAELGRQLARERGERRVEGAAYLLAAARAEEKDALDEAVALLMRMSQRDVDAALRRSRELASEY